jgi:DNA (cytosine-5)-methyltransferase 1
MRILDLFCCAGGAGMGYHRAGFEVVGVDIKPQPRYPFPFILGDAIDVLTRMLQGEKFLASDGRWYGIEDFDAIHASPPCQKYTRMNKGLLQSQGRNKVHPDLIEPTRRALRATGLPYVMENVEGAPLLDPIMLCGSSFNLLVQRHRLFESNLFLMSMTCTHSLQVYDKPALHRLTGHRKATMSRVVGCYGHGRGKGDDKQAWSTAMGIDWMIRAEIAQAIPPAYTEFIGRQLLAILIPDAAQAGGDQPTIRSEEC